MTEDAATSDVDSSAGPDVDSGGIGTDDAGSDLCPDDPDKTEPGQCGCGVAEDATTDTDTDGDDADGDGICDARAGVTYHFTTCGMVGMNGPSQAYCDSAYEDTSLEGQVTLDSGFQRFKVPSAGVYTIVARGASGGTTNTEVLGGFGAEVGGVFTLKKNDELVIVVGQRGAEKPGCSDYGAGGGGGTFVTRKKTGGDTVNITESDDGMGGVGSDVGGGGGYLGDGNDDSTNGGKAFLNGALGSSDYQPSGFGDGCDDCSVKSKPDTKNDGADADKNGVCDAAETADATYEFGVYRSSGANGPAQGDCDTLYMSTSLQGDVTVTAGYQRWTVPADGSYRITARGAQGGDANDSEFGGKGAEVSGLFDLKKNDELVLAVGQRGESQPACADYGAGGGGASYVAMVMTGGDTVVPLSVDVVPLVVAAGGAGASDSDSGCDGLQDQSVFAGSAQSLGDGKGGMSEWGEGGGGGSYNTGGSGGGYSGGTTWSGFVALGGYSFCDSVAAQGTDGANEGQGSVVIERLAN